MLPAALAAKRDERRQAHGRTLEVFVCEAPAHMRALGERVSVVPRIRLRGPQARRDHVEAREVALRVVVLAALQMLANLRGETVREEPRQTLAACVFFEPLEVGERIEPVPLGPVRRRKHGEHA